MAISVFPDRMNRMDPENPDESIRTIDNYIRYMVDQIEFALTNSFRIVNGLGVSGEELKLVLNQTVNDLSALSSTVVEVSTEVQGKIDKVEGKGLSTNDYTDEEKTKLTGIESGAQSNVIETVKRNGTALTPDANKAVDVAVPVNVSDLTNDSGFQTAAQVQSAVDASVDPILSDAVTYGPASLVTISDVIAGMPFKRLYAAVQFAQAGSGDPSTTNIRGISGQSGANFVISPTETAGDGKTYSYDFSAAGTVYGGNFDAVSGVLNVTHRIETFNGTESWSKETLASGFVQYYTNTNSSGKFPGRMSGRLTSSLGMNWLVGSDAGQYGVAFISSAGYFNIRKDFQNVTELKSFLSDNPLQVVYPLENPVSYQIQRQVVSSLSGSNNIWSDVGPVTVEYGAFLLALQAEIGGLDNRATAVEAVLTNAGPVLYENAQDVYVETGQTSVMSVKALGAVTYKWEHFWNSWTQPNWEGKDTDTLHIPAATSQMNLRQVRCTITGSGWTIYSRVAYIHVT